MKQKELRKPCAGCDKGVMHTGVPLFWKISVQRFGVDFKAVQRQSGLEMMLGSPALAAVMGPDEDLAKPITPRREFHLCEDCVMRNPGIMGIVEDWPEEAKSSEPEPSHVSQERIPEEIKPPKPRRTK